MALIGRRNQLIIVREASPGIYLDGGSHGEILLPKRYLSDSMVPGSIADVFVYRDSEDRLVATTERPHAEVGDFAFLKVVSWDPKPRRVPRLGPAERPASPPPRANSATETRRLDRGACLPG